MRFRDTERLQGSEREPRSALGAGFRAWNPQAETKVGDEGGATRSSANATPKGGRQGDVIAC